jgi:predicted permease
MVAEQEMNEIMDQLGEEYPTNAAGTDIRLQSIGDEASVRDVKRALWLMLGAAALVLLLACANVAHLMLARVSTRVREIAIRRALGAHRGRVIRQLLTESLMLGGIGGATGLIVAVFSVRLFVLLSPADIPRLEIVAVDGAAIAFAVALSIVTAAIFGVAPAIVAWRSSMDASMREQGRSTTSAHTGRLRSVLTAAEVAFALVLLVGAGLMMRSFTGMLNTDPGFRAADAFAFQIVLPLSRYPLPQDRTVGAQRVVDAITRVPGVQTVGAGTSLPPSRMQQGQTFSIAGEPRPERGREPVATYVTATADFHKALGIPLVAGRGFTRDDDDVTRSGRVLIINEELAQRHFPSRDAVGQRLLLGGDSSWVIVGVVGDVQYQGLASDVQPTVYVPWGQHNFAGAFVVVRTTGSMQAVMNAMDDVLHGVDPQMNARELRPLVDVIGENMVRPRFQTWLLGTFGALALTLAAIGIYGVIAYGVAQRASEIGLRLAIGAPENSVIRLLLRRTMVPVIVGLLIGVAGALAASRVMQSMLVDVSPTDLPTFVAMTALLATVAMVAAFIPTIRATRGNPTAALRGD